MPASTLIFVGHANEPNFGFGPKPSYPDGYTLVAAVALPSDHESLSPMVLCDHAFHLTNSIDSGWWDNENVTFLLKIEGTRSTSVGDVVVLPDAYGNRAFYCSNLGWEPIVPLA